METKKQCSGVWSKRLALPRLKIEQVKFDPEGDGHKGLSEEYIRAIQGYAIRGTRKFAVNPESKWPGAAGFHEMSHICLGHTMGCGFMPLNELEASGSAITCLKALGGREAGINAQREHYAEMRELYSERYRDLPGDFRQRVNMAAKGLLAAGWV